MRVVKDARLAILVSLIACMAIPIASNSENSIAAAEKHVTICYGKSESCEYSIKSLSTQSRTPFLFYGREVDQNHPRFLEYSKVLREFASAENCLDDTSSLSPQKQESRFDWRLIDTTEKLEVCLFRVLSSFQNLETAVFWLQASGFELRVKEDRKGNAAYRSGRSRIAHLANFNMNPSTVRNEEQKALLSRILGVFGRSLSVSVGFSASDGIEHVGVSVIRK